jgi:hypothetical protein
MIVNAVLYSFLYTLFLLTLLIPSFRFPSKGEFASKPELQHPGWCPTLHVCVGPFPFLAMEQRKDRKSSSMGSRDDISGSVAKVESVKASFRIGCFGQTNPFVLKTLYNCKGSWVVDILHDQPVDCLLVFPVDSCSFNELCFNSIN